MKSVNEIRDRIDKKYVRYEELKKRYNSLGQIDMQSSEGNTLLEKMAIVEGEIISLEWCLSEID